ncbi:MAG TPA: ABC transporter substrate-binding protein [Acidimicrobiales bacterium]|nr:ABC transporter substrate-binding protein [Acidimicrobiales bacterium]
MKKFSIAVTSMALLASSAVGIAGISASQASATGKKLSGTILVGSIMPLSGAYATTGIAADNSAKLAVKVVNAHGGVLGKKLVIKYSDDDANSTTAALDFKKYVSAGAVAILGSGDAASTTVAEADTLKFPDLGLIDDGGSAIYPNGPSKAPYPWAWSTSLNGYAVGAALGNYAKASCPNGLYVIHDNTYYGEGGLAGIETVIPGSKLLGNDSINENWSSSQPASAALQTEVTNVIASKASCVEVWLTPQDEATFVQLLNTAGGDSITVLGNDETDSDSTFSSLVTNAVLSKVKVISANLKVVQAPTAADKAYNALYLKTYKIKPTVWGQIQYDAVMILAKVINAAHSTKPAKIAAQLNKLTNYHGLTGVLSFTKKIHTSINGPQFVPVQYNASGTSLTTWKTVKN